jgi:serine/threonine protein kinase
MRDFLCHCLCKDPDQRWTAAQLLTHPWVADIKDDEATTTLQELVRLSKERVRTIDMSALAASGLVTNMDSASTATGDTTTGGNDVDSATGSTAAADPAAAAAPSTSSSPPMTKEPVTPVRASVVSFSSVPAAVVGNSVSFSGESSVGASMSVQSLPVPLVLPPTSLSPVAEADAGLARVANETLQPQASWRQGSEAAGFEGAKLNAQMKELRKCKRRQVRAFMVATGATGDSKLLATNRKKTQNA